MQFPIAAARTAACALIFVTGCQTIPPEPLDLAGSAAALRARDVDIPPVRDYAATLADTEGETSVLFDASDGLSLREAQAVALWYNPDLRIARLEAEAASALARAGGRLPDPELGLSAGEKKTDAPPRDRFLRDAGASTRDWISLTSLTITLPLSGRAQAERRADDAAHVAALHAAAEAEWRVLADVQTSWLRWSAAHERVRLLDEHLNLLQDFAAAAQALAAVGELLPSGARMFSIAQGNLEAARMRETAGEAEMRAALLQLLGLVPGVPIDLLPALVTGTPSDSGGAPLDTHPAMLRARAAYDVAEARLRVELRRQYPDITFSPAFSDEQDETTIALGLGIPLPTWNANRRGIAEALAKRTLARAQVEATQLRLAAELAQAQAVLAGARARREHLEKQVAPLVDEQIREALALLRAGEAEMVLVYEALLQAAEVKQALLDATLEEALAHARHASIATPTWPPTKQDGDIEQ